MPATPHPATIHIWSGDFASQQLAFAHLLDAADQTGAVLDLDQCEVIPKGDFGARAAPYFDGIPQIELGPVMVLLATPPGAQSPFGNTDLLTYLGAFEGQAMRAGAIWT